MAIEIEELYKRYGKKMALDGISLSVEEGLFGLMGQNGAGKTTLLRILATLIPKSYGNVSINGIPISDVKRIRSIIGYLPQEFSFYPGMTVLDTMYYFGALSDKGNGYKKTVPELLEMVNLADKADAKVNKLSGGMKRRLGMAVTMISDPMVYLIDEPTAGLDPEERVRFRRLICDLAEKKTVILSTHIIEDIEDTCERMAILHTGNICYDGTVDDALASMDGKVWEMVVDRSFDESEISRAGGIITARTKSKDNYCLRILSETKPDESAHNISPRLEDSFVWKCKNFEMQELEEETE